jgi:3-deoxy-D-manno-octulosonic-acid transferase
MYQIAINSYAGAVRLAARFNPKAQKMVVGQRQTWDILKQKIDPQAKYIWFHAASLGEFEQGRPLMERIRKEQPQYKILLTFFSPSGYEVRKNYDGADVICYLPFDQKHNAKRFLEAVPLEKVIFIKYEFWGNYLSQLAKRHIPTYLISAIFRPNQLFFRWYGGFYRRLLRYFTHLFVQDEASRELLATLSVQNVTVTGDTRFDRVYDIYEQRKTLPLIEQFLEKGDDLVLVAGSTWAKDEEHLIPYFNQQERLKLIIAPHEIHESHIQEILARLERPAVRYSQATEDTVKNADCLIIDNFGLLSSLYRYGDLAYIGGGFGVGIHNTLEAAVYGIPVLFGPNYQRFKEACDLIAVGGGIAVASGEELTGRLNELIAYTDLRKETGEKAGKVVEENRGATKKIIQQLI